jgi:hypothetical protein
MDTNTNHTASQNTVTGERGAQEFVRATVHLAGPVEYETGTPPTTPPRTCRPGSGRPFSTSWTTGRPGLRHRRCGGVRCGGAVAGR